MRPHPISRGGESSSHGSSRPSWSWSNHRKESLSEAFYVGCRCGTVTTTVPFGGGPMQVASEHPLVTIRSSLPSPLTSEVVTEAGANPPESEVTTGRKTGGGCDIRW